MKYKKITLGITLTVATLGGATFLTAYSGAPRTRVKSPVEILEKKYEQLIEKLIEENTVREYTLEEKLKADETKINLYEQFLKENDLLTSDGAYLIPPPKMLYDENGLPHNEGFQGPKLPEGFSAGRE